MGGRLRARDACTVALLQVKIGNRYANPAAAAPRRGVAQRSGGITHFRGNGPKRTSPGPAGTRFCRTFRGCFFGPSPGRAGGWAESVSCDKDKKLFLECSRMLQNATFSPRPRKSNVTKWSIGPTSGAWPGWMSQIVPLRPLWVQRK